MTIKTIGHKKWWSHFWFLPFLISHNKQKQCLITQLILVMQISFDFLIGMKKMEYKTRQWHEKCFVCCTCHNPIGTKSFIPKDHDIYCAKCYEDKFATKCIKCNKVRYRLYMLCLKVFDICWPIFPTTWFLVDRKKSNKIILIWFIFYCHRFDFFQALILGLDFTVWQEINCQWQ